jgi:hypothetical protein
MPSCQLYPEQVEYGGSGKWCKTKLRVSRDQITPSSGWSSRNKLDSCKALHPHSNCCLIFLVKTKGKTKISGYFREKNANFTGFKIKHRLTSLENCLALLSKF